MIQISRLEASKVGPGGARIGAGDTAAEAPWAHLIPPDQWAVYERVLALATERGIAFALGGGLAFSHYARRWRNTKDIDLYIKPADKDAMIDVLNTTGLADYYDVMAYDRAWIYRSHNGHGIIVDIIWQMANYRAQVDDDWLLKGEVVRVQGWPLRLLPPEELLWSKLYVLQRDRCDWGDLLNILFSCGRDLNWGRLMERVGDDRRLLAALLELFTWACPERARELPARVWKQLEICAPTFNGPAPAADAGHIRLLDSRDWFGPNQSAEPGAADAPATRPSP